MMYSCCSVCFGWLSRRGHNSVVGHDVARYFTLAHILRDVLAVVDVWGGDGQCAVVARRTNG